MKRCPQCGAEYDDYVQYCFVDGAELTEAAVGPPPAAAKRATPVPPPPVQPPPRPVAPPPPVHRPVQETARGLSIWALVLLFMFVIALFGVGGVVGALFLIGGSGPTAQPVDTPRPAPLPPPVPSPRDNSDEVTTKVLFQSDPPGAQVWEEDELVCEPTPCHINQPDFAPTERRFTLKLAGYPETPYTMKDPSQIQNVQFPRSNKARPPKPRGGGDDILIQR